MRSAFVASALVAGLFVPAAPAALDAAGGPAAGQSAQITAAEAEPFIGEWTLALQGPNGPGTFNVLLKVEAERVVGEIGNEAVPTQKFTSISKTAKGVAMSYSFPYEAMTVDAVVSLMPGADGKVAGQIDFAGGAYTMTGTATKKEKAK
jgi:hypothetical protein